MDGYAQVEQTDLPESWASLVADAVARGTFRPATHNGHPVASRARVRLRVQAPEPAPSAGGPIESQEARRTDEIVPPVAPASPPPDAAETAFTATARAARPQSTALRLEAEQVRDVAGTFGDPFRVVDSLPGVVPVFSGVPYVYVRGAPPSGTVYYWNDLLLPQLFHFALGRLCGSRYYVPISSAGPSRTASHWRSSVF